MFYYVSGTLVHKEPSFVAIDCAGVAYRLTVSGSTSDALGDRMGTTVKLYTYLQVREDNIELFGFATNEELQAFRLLIGVSGVGPKAAMSILTQLTPSRFTYAVCTEDVKAIAKSPGIGPKTASRIVLDLKDKLSKEYLGADDAGISSSPSSGAAPQKGGKLSEATEALMALGYDKSEVLNALRGVDTEKMTVEQIITAALKKFV